MKICTIAGAEAEIHAADPGSVVIDKSNHDLVDAVQKYLEKTIYIIERNISYMYDLHATLKMEGGKMRLELVVECAYDDGNKQASMNLTTPPDQHDNIYTDARHYGDDEFDTVYEEDEEENLPF